MSQETIQYLNTNTLIGFTEKRGTAWHYRAAEQGEESNHYPGAIPIEDVRRRLFPWEAVKGEVTTHLLTPEGVSEIVAPDFCTVIRPDTGEVLGVHGKGYMIHQYPQWLLDELAFLLDSELEIGAAGVLGNGRRAWVALEVPESIETPEGVTFRPVLTAASSHDGSLATAYFRSVTLPVCDNTLSAAYRETTEGGKVKVRHTASSQMKLKDAREALGIVYSTADDFSAKVAELCATKVSEPQWLGFMDSLVPLRDPETHELKSGRSLTLAENKRDRLNRLWKTDERVAPWRGTAFGVLQAVNTYTHHEGNVKGDRAERNVTRAISGGVDRLDKETLDTLEAVLV